MYINWKPAALLLIYLPLAGLAQSRSVLAVFAHPDDEVWWGTGAMLAKYAQDGHNVYLATVTSGQIGITSFANIPAGPELGAVREDELRCSAAALGIHPPTAFGFFDQGLTSSVVLDEVAKRLRKVIAEVRPEVIITHSPDGISGHIDHRLTSAITTEVFQEQSRLEYGPSKLYYIGYPTSKIPLASGATDGRRVFRTVSDELFTTVVESSAGNAAADAALECHKSQTTASDRQSLKNYHRTSLGSMVYLRLAISKYVWPTEKETSVFTSP